MNCDAEIDGYWKDRLAMAESKRNLVGELETARNTTKELTDMVRIPGVLAESGYVSSHVVVQGGMSFSRERAIIVIKGLIKVFGISEDELC